MCDAGLDHCVTIDHTALSKAERWTVERMRHGANQARYSSTRNACIGVEGDHIAHSGNHLGRLAGHRYERCICRAEQKMIQLFQFSALAFPPHPLLLRLIPDAPSMKQKEAFTAARSRAVALIQRRDPVHSEGQEIVV